MAHPYLSKSNFELSYNADADCNCNLLLQEGKFHQCFYPMNRVWLVLPDVIATVLHLEDSIQMLRDFS